jgi:hypothetical protein
MPRTIVISYLGSGLEPVVVCLEWGVLLCMPRTVIVVYLGSGLEPL